MDPAPSENLSLGVTIGALILHLSLSVHGSSALPVANFEPAFVITGLLALLATLMFFLLEPHAGEVVSGRRSTLIDSAPTEEAAAVD